MTKIHSNRSGKVALDVNDASQVVIATQSQNNDNWVRLTPAEARELAQRIDDMARDVDGVSAYGRIREERDAAQADLAHVTDAINALDEANGYIVEQAEKQIAATDDLLKAMRAARKTNAKYHYLRGVRHALQLLVDNYRQEQAANVSEAAPVKAPLTYGFDYTGLSGFMSESGVDVDEVIQTKADTATQD